MPFPSLVALPLTSLYPTFTPTASVQEKSMEVDDGTFSDEPPEGPWIDDVLLDSITRDGRVEL